MLGWGFGVGVLNRVFQLMKYSVDGVLGLWYGGFCVSFLVGASNKLSYKNKPGKKTLLTTTIKFGSIIRVTVEFEVPCLQCRCRNCNSDVISI